MRSGEIQGKIVEQDVKNGNAFVTRGSAMDGWMEEEILDNNGSKKQPVNSP